MTKVIRRKNQRERFRWYLKPNKEMETEIKGNEMLSDLTINCAQLILHRQFPLKEGFEDTECGLHKTFTVRKNAFIQILFSHGHWVTVAAEDEKEVHIFDSLSRPKGICRETILRQICNLRQSNSSNIRVFTKPVQQQTNGIECGLYSIAFAVELAHGYSPVKSNFNQSKMREHLWNCLKNEIFTPFPKTEKRIKRCDQIISFLSLYCTCRDTFFTDDPDNDPGLFMIQCLSCQEWYHKRCEKVKVKWFKSNSQEWKCSLCR